MIELTSGLLIAISIYMILEHDIRRRVFGIALLGSAINIILLLCGGLSQNMPAFINDVATDKMANSVPQALILTAIVIGFGLLVFLCVLIRLLRKV